MKYFKKLVGENVYLSPMSMEDAEIYTKWMNDFEVTNGLGSSSRITSLVAEKDWINRSCESGAYQFAIVDLKTDKLLGNCGYNTVNNLKRVGTVGIFIGDKENRGRGLGTEALKLLIEYGFDYLNLHNIDLQVYSFNKGAIKCYKKAGFKEYGIRHEVCALKGVLYDDVLLEILESDYRKGN